MKKIISLIFFAFILVNLDAQILIGKKAIAQRDYEKSVNDGWDIVIDPIEVVPEKTTSLRKMQATVATNWGRDILLPNEIRQRLLSECKYKVCVKIGDTGDPNHDYLRTGHRPAANYTSDPTVEDGHGHSTHVCGIIAANELGLLEALVQNGLVEFKACKILSNSGSGSFDWVASMFSGELGEDTTLLKRGTYVVYNMSLGGGTAKVPSVETAMAKSTSYGVFIAVANGNTGGPGVQYPGNSVYVIGTASLDQGLTRSSYSTYGPETMVAMPGRSINSTYKGNTFAVLSGTSMATPFTAATIAIARSKWGPKIKSVDHLRSYLAKCATDLPPAGRDEYTGWGIEYVKRILDTNPDSIDTTPPPPPVIDPDSTKRETRILTIPLTGDWKIVYNPTLSEVKTKGWWIFKKPTPVEVRTIEGSEFNTFVENQATATLTVTKMEVAVKTDYYFTFTYKNLLSLTNKYFTSRGLVFNSAADLSEGLNYTAYFYDLVLYLQYGGCDVDVLRIEGKDASGRTLFIDGSKLRKYTPAK